MICFNVFVPQEEIQRFNRAKLKTEVCAENMVRIAKSGDVHAIRTYQDVQEEAIMQFNDLKRELEHEHLPAQLVEKHQYDWCLDSTGMHVKVFCECGEKIVRELGLVR